MDAVTSPHRSSRNEINSIVLLAMIALAFAVLISVALFSTEDSDAADFTADEIEYEISSESAVKVVGNTIGDDHPGNVVIPSTVEYGGKEYRVTSIGENAFFYCRYLKSVVLPDTITSIGDGAFNVCCNMTSINLPNSITSIGESAFYGCDSLVTVDLPDNLTSIGKDVFGYCESLTTVIYPNNLTSIGEDAFIGCKSLTSVTIPDSVTSLGEGSFSKCTSLTSAVIGDGISTVSSWAFEGCSSLVSLTLGSKVKSIGSYSFSSCYHLVEICNDSSMSLVIGSSGNGYVATYAVNIYSSDEGSSILGYQDINDTSKAVYFEKDGSTYLVMITNSGDSVILPDTLNGKSYSVNDYAFYDCGSLSSVTMGDNVTSIGKNAFYRCSSLTSVEFSDSTSSIGNYVFSKCTSLTSVDLPDSLVSIGEYAFSGCSSLKTVDIPSAVTSIGKCAFNECYSLIDIDVSEYNTAYSSSNGVLFDKEMTTLLQYPLGKRDYSYTIPDTVTSVGEKAFYNCTALVSLNITESVASIGSQAFCGCYCLVEICNDSSLAITKGSYGDGYVAYYAVNVYSSDNGSSKLRHYLPDQNTDLIYYYSTGTDDDIVNIVKAVKIGDLAVLSDSIYGKSYNIKTYAFDNCTSLRTISFGSGILSIGSYAFNGCTSLEYIVIPGGISVGSYAFSGCTSLESVTIGEGSWNIGSNVFSGCSGLKTVINYSDLDLVRGASAYSHIARYADEIINLQDTATVDGMTVKYDADKKKAALVGHSSEKTDLDLTAVVINGETYQFVSFKEGLFDNDDELISIIIGDGFTHISDYAFYNCSSLTSVTIGDGVSIIGNDVFSSCSSLTSVVLPDDLTAIGEDAFLHCSSLQTITIPDSVTYIGDGAFSSCSSLVSINIPNGVVSVSDHTFAWCKSLTSIIIPDRIVSIGQGSFRGCSSLASVTIGSGVTTIGSYAFSYCDSLTSMTIPDTVVEVGDYAFYECDSLKCVIIGDGVGTIGREAFTWCQSLLSVTLGESVTTIGSNAFAGCYHLVEICNDSSLELVKGSYDNGGIASCAVNIYSSEEGSSVLRYQTLDDSSVAVYFTDDSGTYLVKIEDMNEDVTLPGKLGGSSYGINKYAFYGCADLESIILPDSLTSIGSNAFYGCRSLVSIAFPDTLTEIGDYAFWTCYRLIEICNDSDISLTIGSQENGYAAYYALNIYSSTEGSSKLGEQTLDDSSKAIYFADDSGTYLIKMKDMKSTVVLPETLGGKSYGIYDNAFYYCTSLESVILPENLTSIGDDAFNSCKNLKAIDIPDTVTSIGNFAFSECNHMATVEIGDGVLSIGKGAFYNCNYLTSVVIPDSVTSLGDRAFDDCTGLKTVVIGDGVTSLGSKVFYKCGALETVEIGDNVVSIGESAFYYCDSLTSVIIPDSVISIGKSAFYYCRDLASVTVGEQVQSIGDSAFYSCWDCDTVVNRSLLDITKGSDSYGYVARYAVTVTGTVSTATVNGLTVSYNDLSKKASLIDHISGMTDFTLDSIAIGDETYEFISFKSNLFYNDTDLVSIVLGKGFRYIPEFSFYGCTGLTSITLGENIVTIGDNAFYKCYSLVEICNDSPLSLIKGSYHNGYVADYAVNIYSSEEGASILRYQGFGDSSTAVYFADDTGTYLVKVCGTGDTVILPNSLGGNPYNIYKFAFYGFDTMTSVTIPDGVTSIGERSFSDCTGLTSVTLGNDLVSIGDYAFDEVKYITSLAIPDSVTTIGDYAFYDLKSLVSLDIGNGVTDIYWVVFYYTFYDTDGRTRLSPGEIPGYSFHSVSWRMVRDTNIFFDENGGSKEMTDTAMKTGGTYVLPGYYGKVLGHKFAGWSYDGTVYVAGSSVVKTEGDMTFVATWVVDQFKISFDSGYGSSVNPIVQDYGTEVSAPEDPVKYGFTFVKWTLNGSDYEFTTMPGENITLRAVWEINQYTMTFDTDGGSSIEPITQDYNTKINEPTVPTKTGYTFSKWTWDGEDYVIKWMPGENITLRAVWAINQYTITFDTDGGSSMEPMTCDYGSEVNAPEVPVKEGHKFVKWTLNGEDYKFTVMPAEDISLKAVWELQSYTVSFLIDGERFEEYVLEYGSEIVPLGVVPTKESTVEYDYTFSGWDGYTEGMTVSEDTVFDALFNEKKRIYTVKFLYGEDTILAGDLEYGSEIICPTKQLTKESTPKYDYVFSGWNGYTEGMTVSGDAEFEAAFDEIVRQYTVIFMNGTEVFRTYSIAYDSEITVPDVLPSKASTDKYDYSFVNWSGYTDGMKVSGAYSFSAVYEPVLKKIDTAKEKVTVDANDVDDVKISSDVIDQIRNAGAQGKDTTISMSNGSITLDGASASALSAGAKSITLQTVEKESIPEKIRSQIGDRPVYSINIGDVHEFNGTLTISVKYDLRDGEKAEDVCIWYIKSDGSYDKIACTYSNGYATFTTNHLSEYAVMIEESQPAPAESGSNLGLIIGGVVAAVAILAVAVFFVKRH